MVNPVTARSTRAPAPPASASEKGAQTADARKTVAQAPELQNAPPGARITDVKEKPGGGRTITIDVPANSVRETAPAASPFAALDRIKARFVPPPAIAPRTGQLPEPRPAFGAIRPEDISTFTAGASSEAGGKPRTAGKIEIGGFVAAGATLAATDGPAPFMDVLGLGVVAVGAVLHGARNLVELGKDAGVMPSIAKENLDDTRNGVRPDLLPDPGVEQLARDRVRPPVAPKDPAPADPNAAAKRPAPPDPEFTVVSGLPKPDPGEDLSMPRTTFPGTGRADSRSGDRGGLLERIFRTGNADLETTRRLRGDVPKTEEEKLAVVDEILQSIDPDDSAKASAAMARKKLVAFLGDRYDQVDSEGRSYARLKDSELAALYGYTVDLYEGMKAARNGEYNNEALLGADGRPDESLIRGYLNLGEIIAGAQDRVPMISGVFRRGTEMTPEELAKFAPGNIVQTSTVMSAATEDLESESYNDRPVQIYFQGRAMRLEPLNPDEKEALIPSGIKYRVMSREVVAHPDFGYPQVRIYLGEVK